MLHPFMPFVTEELWHAMGDRGGKDLILAEWPAPEVDVDRAEKASVDTLLSYINGVRGLRAELSIPWTAELVPHLVSEGADAPLSALQETLDRYRPQVRQMTKSGSAVTVDEVPGSSAQIVVDGVTIAFPLGEVIDLEAEKARLAKAAEVAAKERDNLAARLANPAFAERAKPEAVAKARADHEARAAEAERLAAALARLG
jgi:valyl-tRNA synthetase